MNLQAREQVKTLLAQENIKMKQLAQMFSEETGKKCSADCLSHKLRYGTLRYNDFLVIVKILGYKIRLEKE